MPGPPNTGVRKPHLLRSARENVGRIYTLFHRGRVSIRLAARNQQLAVVRAFFARGVAIVAAVSRVGVRACDGAKKSLQSQRYGEALGVLGRQVRDHY